MSEDSRKKGVQTEEVDWGGLTGQSHQRTETVKNNGAGELLKNAHVGLPDPETNIVRRSLVSGECLYFHYGCDGQDDRGWGCGYRTLQTLSSWLCLSWSQLRNNIPPPSLCKIQQALVTMGDKPPSFVGSREWIGTFEAALVLDHFYDVPCRIVHVRGGGAELEGVAEELHQHFQSQGSPVMMGGDRDNSSKGILGVCTGARGSYLLVLDPHYYGPPLDRETTQRLGWVSWKRVGSLDHGSFYNLCLPQTVRK
ncbi:inactive Ufm1-specific protease 1 [Megalops cyprinoides]|uniref:inactive Ufm1-specific protease 1 n=1 Tax=Megalops cyprinoides TaxID=118141 RepID=UPI0018649E62|nr:inactive Ufm1-specific protease 1 [Megalops cyprinoides]